MYHLYSVLPCDIVDKIKNILLNDIVYSKTLHCTNNIISIIQRYKYYKKFYSEYRLLYIYRIIISDVDYIYYNITDLYNNFLYKDNIYRQYIPNEYKYIKKNLQNWCININCTIMYRDYSNEYTSFSYKKINNLLVNNNITTKINTIYALLSNPLY